MKVLQICHKPPVPSRDGGCLAMNSITQGLLKQGVKVKVLTICTPKHDFDRALLDQLYVQLTEIESVFVNTDLHPKDALLSLLKGESYNVNRFYDAKFEKLIVATINNQPFDVVHLESLFVLPYLESIRKCFNGKVVVRTHNIEHIIWQDLASVERNPIKRKYLSVLAKQLKKFEISNLKKVDGIASISGNDKDIFKQMGCAVSSTTIPYGLQVGKMLSTTHKGLFFMGALDWQPNIDGINWLSERVAKSLSCPVKIAGRNPSKELNLTSNMELIGEIDDASLFMKSNGIMLVPLFSGGGIRIKILEAMSWGVPIVATNKAVEGLAVEHGKHALITDDPGQFACYANQLLEDSSLCQTLAQNAYSFVQKNYDPQLLANKLVSFYNQLINE
jgi:polysaccharide biosynthesis protein PslH